MKYYSLSASNTRRRSKRSLGAVQQRVDYGVIRIVLHDANLIVSITVKNVQAVGHDEETHINATIGPHPCCIA